MPISETAASDAAARYFEWIRGGTHLRSTLYEVFKRMAALADSLVEQSCEIHVCLVCGSDLTDCASFEPHAPDCPLVEMLAVLTVQS